MPPKSVLQKCWFFVLLAAGIVPERVQAVERSILIEAPQNVLMGQPLRVVVSASTNAGNGERIGFFQVEYSRETDSEWVPLAYLDNIGETHHQEFILPSDVQGKLSVRARVAFRDGLAGDVDRAGAAIRWRNAWAEWREPTACLAVIDVLKVPH